MNQLRAAFFIFSVFSCAPGVLADVLPGTEQSADADFDGLPDSIEHRLGTDALLPDTDGDGVSDLSEVGADILNPLDSDGDRRIDALDIDDDNDGIPTIFEAKYDSDFDGIADYLDQDADGDGRSDRDEAGISGLDTDNDGLDDVFDADHSRTEDGNGDGINGHRLLPDSDGDGVPDVLDTVDDGDFGDLDGDGLSNALELKLGSSSEVSDSDDDGVPDGLEAGETDAIIDTDQDGVPDIIDDDDDGDGVPTRREVPDLPLPPHYFDVDADGLPNYLDADDDGDGVLSAAEDLNGNGVLADDDSDLDGIADYLDYDDSDGPGSDRDNDGLTDRQEIALGSDPAGTDTDGDGIADDLEIGFDESRPVDTDGDGIFDFLDQDDDGDGIPTLLEGEQDRDNDGRVNYLDVDATLYFYCADNGRIVSGVSDFKVFPTEYVELSGDAAAGWFRWQAIQPGTYTLKFTLPVGMRTMDGLDKGMFVGPEPDQDNKVTVVSLGRGEDIVRPGYLADFSAKELPIWYRRFRIDYSGARIVNLNIPVLGGDCGSEQ